MHALISAICLPLFNQSWMKNKSEALFLLRILLQPVALTFNVVNMLGLLFLFHSQGIKRKALKTESLSSLIEEQVDFPELTQGESTKIVDTN